MKNRILRNIFCVSILIVLSFVFVSCDDKTKEHEHTYGDWYVSVAAECTKDGEERRDCTVKGCETFETKTTEAYGHSYTDGACVICAEPESKEEFHVHKFGDWVIVKAPNCVSDGLQERKCADTNCNETQSVILNALKHDVVGYEAKAASCTENGHTAYVTCNRCTYSSYKVIAATGHKYDGGVCVYCHQSDDGVLDHDHVLSAEREVVVAEATCESAITYKRTCTLDGCKYFELETEGEPLPHDIVRHDAKTPTCTEVGWEAYETCKNCDYTTKEEKLANHSEAYYTDGGKCEVCGAHRHVYDDNGWQIEKAATCTEDGKRYRTCTVEGCDALPQEEILSKLGHTYGDDNKCTRCGEVKTHDHLFATESVVLEPTCTTPGKEKRKCTVEGCTETETVSIPALGHDAVVHEKVPATCNTDGSEEYETCNRCDYQSLTDEQIKIPAAHKYENGICTICTKRNPDDNTLPPQPFGEDEE